MTRDILRVLAGTPVDEEAELTLTEFCRVCALRQETIIALVEEGILEPKGDDTTRWSFHRTHVRRARVAARLQHDLGVNLAGAALAMELLDRIEQLQVRVRHLQYRRR